jgi:TonB family protein
MRTVRLSMRRIWALNASITITVLLSSAVLAEDAKRIPSAEALSARTSKNPPEYPETAKRLRIEGSVEVEATISAEGAVESVSTLRGNPMLVRPAVEAVKKWKFRPFTSEGKPVRAISTFTIDFKM